MDLAIPGEKIYFPNFVNPEEKFLKEHLKTQQSLTLRRDQKLENLKPKQSLNSNHGRISGRQRLIVTNMLDFSIQITRRQSYFTLHKYLIIDVLVQ